MDPVSLVIGIVIGLVALPIIATGIVLALVRKAPFGVEIPNLGFVETEPIDEAVERAR